MELYLVTLNKEFSEENTGVEIVGLFTSKEKAYEAKAIISQNLENEGYEDDDYDIFVTKMEPDMISWGDISKKL